MVKVKVGESRIQQGDIFRDVEFIEYIVEKEGDVAISKIIFPLVIILSQDCDLAQDHKFRYGRPRPSNQDKYLLSVLVAPLYNADHLYLGEHLNTIDILMSSINKKKSPGKNLRDNKDPRYHYLEFPPEVPVVASVIDFKHYFSLNNQYLKSIKRTNFLFSIAPVFREDISQRFASFLSRIGLPPA